MIFAFLLSALLLSPPPSSSLQPPSNPTPNQTFSLPSYRKSRALETSRHLDASRFHFQILFVDDDNSHGRIAEGLLARTAEHNDAMFVLFPSSATIDSSRRSPRDAEAPDAAVAACVGLGLCGVGSRAVGSSFGLENLDEYDLVVSTNEEVQGRIVGALSAEEQGVYGSKCRTLEEFLSVDFCNVHAAEGGAEGSAGEGTDVLLDMLDPELYGRAAPFAETIAQSTNSLLPPSTLTPTFVSVPRVVLSPTSGAAVPNPHGWPLEEAALLLATAGVVRFCLGAMDSQMEAAFGRLLEGHFTGTEEDLECGFEEADGRLRQGSSGVTGYFSPEGRRRMWERHVEGLRARREEGCG